MSIAIPLSAWATWRIDALGIAAVVAALLYLWAAGRTQGRLRVPGARRAAFVVGCVVLVVISCGPVGEYAPRLFWVRALQITVLLYLVPLALTAGTPVTVVAGLLSPTARLRGLHALRGPIPRMLTYPAVTSGLLLVTPWVLLFTGWNIAAMTHPALDLLTRLFLVAAGFGYYYARSQADPVPRRFPQSLSLVITLVESLADGVLGVVVWLGPDIYAGYYRSVGFTEHSQMRDSQMIGAGMLWLLADVIGLPFLMILMTALRREDARRQARVDAAQDEAEMRASLGTAPSAPGSGAPDGGALWWENDPRFADRFHH
ncbi:cytochrome c oxidase assembly protein [Tsukamurella soli]|uniref:Cytochrome c oxidase assembly protein n=1 Tax=Tsukamurella soli TaxID=644556 RepID=A0ABP8JXK3_9ACTN